MVWGGGGWSGRSDNGVIHESNEGGVELTRFGGAVGWGSFFGFGGTCERCGALLVLCRVHTGSLLSLVRFIEIIFNCVSPSSLKEMGGRFGRKIQCMVRGQCAHTLQPHTSTNATRRCSSGYPLPSPPPSQRGLGSPHRRQDARRPPLGTGGPASAARAAFSRGGAARRPCSSSCSR